MPLRAMLLGAMGLGLSDALSQTVLPISHWLPALGAPWLIIAFLVASYATDYRRAAIAGTLTIAGGTLLYYIMMIAHSADMRHISIIAAGWMLAAIPIGGLFGMAGHAWRSGHGFAGLTTLGAGLIGEACLLALIWPTAAWPFLLVEAIIGLGVLTGAWRLRQNHTRWYSPTFVRVSVMVGLAMTMALSEAAVRVVLRATGWGGL